MLIPTLAMASSTTPGSKPSKTMSSRLLTMKFMQRAAASSSPAPTEDPATPSPKRQRLSTTNSDSAPSPRQPISDLEAIQAALAAEEQKRADAIARQAAEAGETNWVLSFGEDSARTTTPFSVVASATAQPMIIAADSLDAEEQDASHDGGRKCYGGFKSRNRKVVFENLEEAVPSDPEELAAYMQEKKRKAKLEEKRVDKALQKATSISGGGRPMVNDRDKSRHGGATAGKKRNK